MVSLQICFMGWICEVVGTLFKVFTPKLHDLGFPLVYLADAIIMFVIIPFIHLVNDEETKAVIAEQNWYRGLGYLLGMYKQGFPQ